MYRACALSEVEILCHLVYLYHNQRQVKVVMKVERALDALAVAVHARARDGRREARFFALCFLPICLACVWCVLLLYFARVRVCSARENLL